MTAGHVGDDTAIRAVALAGVRSGKSMREIAVDLYGADEVAADWHSDSRMRAKVRRLTNRTQAASGGGPDEAGHDAPRQMETKPDARRARARAGHRGAGKRSRP